MNEELCATNKKLQFLKNASYFKHHTIHEGIEQEIIGRLIPSYLGHLDQYLSGAGELHLHIGISDKRPVGMGYPIKVNVIRDYCVIFKKLLTCGQKFFQLNRHGKATHIKTNNKVLSSATEGDKLAVLISVSQTAEDSQSDDIGVNLLPKKTKVVRLQRYDECPSLRVQSFGGSLKILPQLGILDHELTIFVLSEDVLKQDGEARILSALFRDASDDNIIKCSSQVMYEIAEHDSNHGVRLLRDTETTPDLLLAVRQPDTSEIVRLAFCVPHGCLIDVLHVLFSPLNLEPPVFHDMLYYPFVKEDFLSPLADRLPMLRGWWVGKDKIGFVPSLIPLHLKPV
jgi:hypothetical protein